MVGRQKVGVVKGGVSYLCNNNLFDTHFTSRTTKAEISISQSHSFQIPFLEKPNSKAGVPWQARLVMECEDKLATSSHENTWQRAKIVHPSCRSTLIRRTTK